MQTYTGGCHCGAVRFEATADITQVMSCNCSRCNKLGWLLAFIPATQCKLLSGREHLTEYRFNKKQIAHFFCNVCGIESFAQGSAPDGTETVALNVRCLDNIDIKALPATEYNGKAV